MTINKNIKCPKCEKLQIHGHPMQIGVGDEQSETSDQVIIVACNECGTILGVYKNN